MRDILYLPLRKISLLYSYFLFFDTTPYLADEIFIRHNVRVWFDSEYVRDGFSYRPIMCHVKKKDVPEFLAAMEDLKKNMLICGHEDYAESVSAFLDEMDRKRYD